MFGRRKQSDTERQLKLLHAEIRALFSTVQGLRERVAGLEKRPAAPAAPKRTQVEEMLPIIDRFHELLLIEKGHADLAQAFGSYARQREQAEPAVQWEEPGEQSGYDATTVYGG